MHMWGIKLPVQDSGLNLLGGVIAVIIFIPIVIIFILFELCFIQRSQWMFVPWRKKW